MSNPIIIYNNDLNKVSLNMLKAPEQNLLFSIIFRCQERGTDKISFALPILRDMLERITGQDYKPNNVAKYCRGLYKRFFKLDFISIIEDGKTVTEEHINLFQMMGIETDVATREMIRLNVQISERFAYLINKCLKNFTRFDLLEFCKLQSAYAKGIFRLLKQHRFEGKFYADLAWLRDYFALPPKYRVADIQKIVINKAIKEIAPFFKDLKAEPHLGYKDGALRKSTLGWQFTFEPETRVAPQQREQAQPQEQQPSMYGDSINRAETAVRQMQTQTQQPKGGTESAVQKREPHYADTYEHQLTFLYEAQKKEEEEAAKHIPLHAQGAPLPYETKAKIDAKYKKYLEDAREHYHVDKFGNPLPQDPAPSSDSPVIDANDIPF